MLSSAIRIVLFGLCPQPQQHFNIVKQLEPGHFGMPLGIAALGLAWYEAVLTESSRYSLIESDTTFRHVSHHRKTMSRAGNHLGAPKNIFHVIGYVAVIVYILMFLVLVRVTDTTSDSKSLVMRYDHTLKISLFSM